MTVSNKTPYATALTHAGIFHADDVFAAAILKMVFLDIRFIRSNQVPPDFNGIVFDVGGGEFDHHTGDKKIRANGMPYAAFGLIWKEFGHCLLDDSEDRESFDRSFVEPIDLSDNSGKHNPVSQIIADFNPLEYNPLDAEDRFQKAVDFAITILNNRFTFIRYERNCINKVMEIYHNQQTRIVVLDHFIPWKKALINTDAVYVIYPGARGGYNLQVVPISEEDVTAKKDLPHDWWGKSGEELQQASGIPQLTFCHNTGFLAAAESLDGARQAAQTALQA